VGLAVLACGASGAGAGFAAADADSSGAPAKRGFFDRLSPPRLRVWGFVYLPKVYYASETSFGVGGQILRPFSLGGDRASDSEVQVGGRFMAKGQGAAGFAVNLGDATTTYSAKSKLEFSNIPRRFYGIGPDTPGEDEEVFQRQSLLAYLEVYRRVASRLRVGLRAEVESAQLLETEPGGLLETLPIAGVQRSSVAGWGVSADWDSRDDRYWPTTGSFHQSFLMGFGDELRGDYSFHVYYLDLRRYLTTAQNHVLALQAFLYATDGGPPFWRMAEMGGRGHSRGYDRGRYRDRVIMAFQAEHRFAVWRRLGLVGFAGLADVASRLEQMQLEHMRPTFGGGLRFRVGGQENRINARLDVAYGDEFQFYFKLDEAF
jgi:hypothetical protein